MDARAPSSKGPIRRTQPSRDPGGALDGLSDSLTPYCDERVEDVGPSLLVAALFGFAFGSTSRGFFYYVLYFSLFEVIYAVSIRCHYTPQNTIKRLGIFSTGLLAFLITRLVVCDDCEPFRPTYDEAPSMDQIFSSLTCSSPRRGNRKFGKWRRAKRA